MFFSVKHPRRHFALWYFTVIVSILNPKHNNISWFGLSSSVEFSLFFSLAQNFVRILVVTLEKKDLAEGIGTDTTHRSGKNDHWRMILWIYMRVVLNSFTWKTPSSPKKNSFAELSRTPCLSFAVHVGQDFEAKHGCVISSNCSRRLIPCHTSFCGRCT